MLSSSEHLARFLLRPALAPRPSEASLPDAAAFSGFIREHKLPLDEVIAVNGLAQDPLLNAACLRDELSADRERHRAVREEFTAFREALDRDGIPHLLVKGVYGVPYRSDNIDILIPDGDMARAGRILEGLGYIYNKFSYDRYKLLYNRLAGIRVTGIMHLHRLVGWYSPFITARDLFAEAVDGSEAGVRLPRPEVSLAIIGAHALYEDARIRLIDMHKVMTLLRQCDVDWPFVWRLAEHGGFAAGLALFFLVLEQQHRRLYDRPWFDVRFLEAARKRLSFADGTRRHFYRYVADRPLAADYRMSKYFVRRCLFLQVKRSGLIGPRAKARIAADILGAGMRQVSRVRPQPSMLIAICGPDGCGKTTQVQRMAAVFSSFEINARCSWARIGDSPLLNGLKALFRGRVRGAVPTAGGYTEGAFKSPLARRLWPCIAVPDYILRQYAAVFTGYLLQRAVIADRYHVDALVDLAHRCGPEVLRQRWIIAALRMLPRAHAAFVLQVPDAVLRQRRGDEYIPGVSDNATRFYAEAAEIFGARIVDARQDADALAEALCRDALCAFMSRTKNYGPPL